MLDDVIGYLRCPHCGGDLMWDSDVVRCTAGHAFDVARQGYVNLHGGPANKMTGDTAAMVQARAAFLDAGHYAGVADALETACSRPSAVASSGCVVDVGAGTGYYLRRVLERLDGMVGLALDVSRYAVRRAARAHPRIGAVACDVWEALPVRSGAAAVVLSLFAPRNGAEFHRILRADGLCVVVTPTVAHLAELVCSLGLLTVDRCKQERLSQQLGPYFTELERDTVEMTLELGHGAVMNLAAMGPTAWHTPRESMLKRIALLPDPVTVTVAVDLSLHRPKPG